MTVQALDGQWVAGPLSAVNGERLSIAGPKWERELTFQVASPAPPAPYAVVIDFEEATGDCVLFALGPDGQELAHSNYTGGQADGRLVVYVEGDGELEHLVLSKFSDEDISLKVKGPTTWSVDAETSAAAVFRPVQLKADPAWGDRAYGAPAFDDDSIGRWLAWLAMSEPRPVAWWSGSHLLLTPGETMSRAIAMSGSYEPETGLALKRVLPTGGVFLDIGANIGVFAVAASRWVGEEGRVIAVEPSPREAAKLRANVDLNGAANVTVLEVAVGAQAGVGQMLLAPATHAGLNTLGPALAHGVEAERTLDVPLTTIDQICDELGLTRIDAIKADIEGGELDLLSGAQEVLERFRPTLIMEVEVTALQSAGREVGEAEAVLRRLGYEIFALEGVDGRPVLIEELTGFERGNVIALPAERSLAFQRQAAATTAEGFTQNLLLEVASVSAQLGEERARVAAGQEAREQLQARLAQVSADADVRHDGLIRETEDLRRMVQEGQAELQQADSVAKIFGDYLVREAEAQRAERARMAHELTSARAAYDAVRDERDAAVVKADTAQAAVELLERRIEQMRAQADDADRDVERARGELETLQAAYEELQQANEQLKRNTERLTRTLTEMARRESLLSGAADEERQRADRLACALQAGQNQSRELELEAALKASQDAASAQATRANSERNRADALAQRLAADADAGAAKDAALSQAEGEIAALRRVIETSKYMKIRRRLVSIFRG